MAKAYRFNVSRIVYAMVLENTKESFKYGTIKEFADPMQVQFTPTVATGVLYGGGKKKEDISKLTGGELVVDATKVDASIRAEIFGHKFENGLVSETTGAQPKDVAIGYEIEQTGDNRELVWLPLGKPRPAAQTVQQSTDNINFSTDSITFGIIGRELDGKVRIFGDTSEATFTDEAAAAFLETIPGGTLVENTGETGGQ